MRDNNTSLKVATGAVLVMKLVLPTRNIRVMFSKRRGFIVGTTNFMTNTAEVATSKFILLLRVLIIIMSEKCVLFMNNFAFLSRRKLFNILTSVLNENNEHCILLHFFGIVAGKFHKTFTVKHVTNDLPPPLLGQRKRSLLAGGS